MVGPFNKSTVHWIKCGFCQSCQYTFCALRSNQRSGMVGPFGESTVRWTKLGFSQSYEYIFCALRSNQRSGMVGPFRPTPEYEAGYSCFQQVKKNIVIYLFFHFTLFLTNCLGMFVVKKLLVLWANTPSSNTFKPPWTTNSAHKKHQRRYGWRWRSMSRWRSW